jgi:hypothetical protein
VDPTFCFDAESDPTFHFDADPYPDLVPHQRDASQQLQTLHGSILSLHASVAGAKGPQWLHFEPAHLLNVDLMRIRNLFLTFI